MDYLAQEKNDWLNLRDQILSNRHDRFNRNSLWSNATTLFLNSLSNKYMTPLRRAGNRGNQSGEGYLIISSLVIVIEVLAGFRRGMIYKNPVENRDLEYNNSKGLLVQFLKNNEIFSRVFDNLNSFADPNTEDVYEDFYLNVRCNLLHGGRLNSNWTISSRNSNVVDDVEFIKYENEKMVIYRNIFVKIVDQYISEYIGLLNDNDRIYNSLRRKFAIRFDWHFNENYTIW